VKVGRAFIAPDWSACAQRLVDVGALPKNDARQIRLIDAFARHIGNTDCNDGNLAFFDRHDGSLALAPVYDMLPMLLAPQDDEVVERAFDAPQPDAGTRDVWMHARRIAESYWERLATESLLSEAFRARSAAALAVLRALPAS
jgi:hypothetical protein